MLYAVANTTNFVSLLFLFLLLYDISVGEESQNLVGPPTTQATHQSLPNGSQMSNVPEAQPVEQAPKPVAKPKAKPKPKAKKDMCLPDYLISTKCIHVRWDQISIDKWRTEGQVRGLNPDRVQAHHEDLLRAPPPNVIDDLLLVRGVLMFYFPCFGCFCRRDTAAVLFVCV